MNDASPQHLRALRRLQTTEPLRVTTAYPLFMTVLGVANVLVALVLHPLWLQVATAVLGLACLFIAYLMHLVETGA